MDKSGIKLVAVETAEEWRALHDIRRAELFSRLNVPYDQRHPDNHAIGKSPFVLSIDGDIIGTARFDTLDGDHAAIRLIAIKKEKQRQGYGRLLVGLLEEYARARRIRTLCVNSYPAAVGFYERLGFRRESWADVATPLNKEHVQLIKQLH